MVLLVKRLTFGYEIVAWELFVVLDRAIHSRAHSRHWCQLYVSLAVETAATQTKPAKAGYKNLNLSLVRAGGLGF